MAEPVVDHYSDAYWNDHPRVLAHLQKRVTGDPGLWWMPYFKSRYASTPFKRGLVIGCGNGWVERDLYDLGVALEFDAFDASPVYLEQAEEARDDRPIRYFESDFQRFEPERTYDLIVNVAALHHAQYLYRVVALLADALEPHGLFVNWDYIGPSRNQYADEHVAAMAAANDALPASCRTHHVLRPPLEQMLDADPTEAVHSGEIIRAVGEWFDFVERRDLGGAILYQLLWNNVGPFQQDEPAVRDALERLLELDATVTDEEKLPSLFAFFVCRPRRGRPTPAALYHRYIFEPLRESYARRHRATYPREAVRLAVGRRPALARAVRAKNAVAGRLSRRPPPSLPA